MSVILTGSLIAIAISIVFSQFGAAIGLADDAPLGSEDFTSWGVIAVGIWMLWVQLLASLAGGYAAGYLRIPSADVSFHENEMRNGLYGLSVWATSTTLVFIGTAITAAFATYVSVQTGDYDPGQSMTDNEQNASVIFAFVLGAVSLLSAVAAWWAATMGGEHRQSNADFSTYLSFKKK